MIGASLGAVTPLSSIIKLSATKNKGSIDTIVPTGTTPPISSIVLNSISPSLFLETAILSIPALATSNLRYPLTSTLFTKSTGTSDVKTSLSKLSKTILLTSSIHSNLLAMVFSLFG